MGAISVVITCFNEGELLRRAYSSLEAQIDGDFEIVIVNDASRNQVTNRICRELEAEGRARVVWRDRNGGPAAAKNHGVDEMTGEICVPFDADDILPPAAISIIREGFRCAPSAGFVFGDYIRNEMIDNSSEVVDCGVLCNSDRLLDARRLTGEQWLLLGTSPCLKTVWQSVGGHREHFSYDAHDADFFMRLLLSGVQGYYVKELIYIWNRSSGGINSTQPDDTVFRLRLANLEFFDKFGDAIAIRHSYMRRSFSEGDVATAQRLAWQLLKRGHLSSVAVILAYVPPRILVQLHALFLRAIGRRHRTTAKSIGRANFSHQ